MLNFWEVHFHDGLCSPNLFTDQIFCYHEPDDYAVFFRELGVFRKIWMWFTSMLHAFVFSLSRVNIINLLFWSMHLLSVLDITSSLAIYSYTFIWTMFLAHVVQKWSASLFDHDKSNTCSDQSEEIGRDTFTYAFAWVAQKLLDGSFDHDSSFPWQWPFHGCLIHHRILQCIWWFL